MLPLRGNFSCSTFMLLTADRMELAEKIRQMKVRLYAKSKKKERDRVPKGLGRKKRRLYLVNGQKRINGLL